VVLNSTIGTFGKLPACRHANGRDWWMLQFNEETVYSYLISPTGISLENINELPFKSKHVIGQTNFSQDGTKFGSYGITKRDMEDAGELIIADFDRTNGKLLNAQQQIFNTFEHSGINNGLEFSPNGKLLYYSSLIEVVQLDMEADNPFESAITVLEWQEDDICLTSILDAPNKFSTMKLGPDHKFYIANWHQCNKFNIINNPNERGLDCNAEKDVIELSTEVWGNTPTFNTYRLGPLDGSDSDTLGIDNNPISRFWYEQDSSNHQEIQFRDVSYYRPEEWSWTFGDGNSSTERNPIHDFQNNGIYEVCLTVSNENSSNTSCQELQIGPVANQNIQREYDINIFPNPVDDFTRLVFHDYLPEQAKIVLYDASGQKVFSARVYQECMVDLTSLIAGTYLYEIVDGSEFLGSGKIVKM